MTTLAENTTISKDILSVPNTTELDVSRHESTTLGLAKLAGELVVSQSVILGAIELTSATSTTEGIVLAGAAIVAAPLTLMGRYFRNLPR